MMQKQNYPRHILLFLVTVCTTTVAGAQLRTGQFFFGVPPEAQLGWEDLLLGLPFSMAFLAFLTVHEFGHYLTSRYHRVPASLPYYIPFFVPLPMLNIGSFGAVIRIRQKPESRRKYFDIGVMGPLAGFVVAILLLVIGFLTLPELQPYVYDIHPSYESLGRIPDARLLAMNGYEVVSVGGNLLFSGMEWLLADPNRMPPGHEVFHYPLIFAGYLGLFFTALNLLPVGQLDGGHVVYGLFGKKVAGVVSRLTVLTMLMVGGTGLWPWRPFYESIDGSLESYYMWGIFWTLVYIGYLWLIMRAMFRHLAGQRVLMLTGALILIQVGLSLGIGGFQANPLWLLFAFLTAIGVGVDHPATLDETELTPKQKLMGYAALFIFVLCFSFDPIRVF